jgi:U2 small nuclear ribonucleoprotein B''
VIAKLDGTYKMPGTAAAANVEMTETQQSIFNAPAPGSASTTIPAPPSGLPAKPTGSAEPSTQATEAGVRGQKRTRDEEEEEEEDSSDDDVAMEEDSDEE